LFVCCGIVVVPGSFYTFIIISADKKNFPKKISLKNKIRPPKFKFSADSISDDTPKNPKKISQKKFSADSISDENRKKIPNFLSQKNPSRQPE
jgi:hypothetical protein